MSAPPTPPTSSALPYNDSKPVGAADFYSAINATFRFLAARFGLEGLRRYWQDLGKNYYAPVSAQWRQGGLSEVARYWRDFFAAEPGAQARIEEGSDAVEVWVETCPAIQHLRTHHRQIVPEYCQHCYFVSQAMGQAAGIEVRVCGGNGRCRQTFARAGKFPAPQNLEEIEKAL